ncbi:MAG: hypothetical protein II817_00520 [Bacteroidales bacterium]|nr:hypothetical protein [Bacteroidales bacterium]
MLNYSVAELREKKKNDIIDNINSYMSRSQIYEYLKTVLWKDIIMEMVVRKKVQEQIREKRSINNYYDKLWGLTSEAFNRIALNNNEFELTAIYEFIYKKGVNVFIEEK